MLSHVWLFVILWTAACQAPLSMGFSRQEHWSGLPGPPAGESSQPRDWTQVFCFAGRFFTIWATREAPHITIMASNFFDKPTLQRPVMVTKPELSVSESVLSDLAATSHRKGLPQWHSDKESAYIVGASGSLGQEDPLEEGTATHSSILAWRIPWTEEPGGL